MQAYEAVVVGAGPNGLAAAIRLAEAGVATLLVEAADRIGGGLRSAPLTLPGYQHDVCAAVHTLGALSPYFRRLPLAEHGLSWVSPEVSVAHPLDDRPAVLLERELAATAVQLGVDGASYEQLLAPLLDDPHALLRTLLGPLGLPEAPRALLRFALHGLRSARGLSQRFGGVEARALLAGCAAHSILPLERLGTAAFALLFLMTAHVQPWPVVRGGSEQLARALASYFRALGGTIETGRRVRSLAELPAARVLLFDLAPKALLEIAGAALPGGYRKRLARYRYGPGAFKLDYALREPIPWRDPRCARASTVHVGGGFEELAASEAAVWRGELAERPFVLLCQQSHFDPTRAPAGRHTGYAYCHVPAGSTLDATRQIEAQIERFAPGFRDVVLARHSTTAAQLELYNPSYVGGAVAGGAATLDQLFTRPVARLDPYSTPNPRLFLCSHATPPGGGAHGMCGYHAAGSALRRLGR